MLVEPFHTPNHLMFARRRVQDEVGRRHVACRADSLEGSSRFLIKIHVCVADFSDVLLGPAASPSHYRIHADKDVGAGTILLLKPGLEWNARDRFGCQNPLHRLLSSSIAHQDRYLVAWRMEREHVFGCS